jgi:hypothetical protein
LLSRCTKHKQQFESNRPENSQLIDSYDAFVQKLRSIIVHPKLGGGSSTGSSSSGSIFGSASAASSSSSTSSTLSAAIAAAPTTRTTTIRTLEESIPEAQVRLWVNKLRIEFGMSLLFVTSRTWLRVLNSLSYCEHD